MAGAPVSTAIKYSQITSILVKKQLLFDRARKEDEDQLDLLVLPGPRYVSMCMHLEKTQYSIHDLYSFLARVFAALLDSLEMLVAKETRYIRRQKIIKSLFHQRKI